MSFVIVRPIGGRRFKYARILMDSEDTVTVDWTDEPICVGKLFGTSEEADAFRVKHKSVFGPDDISREYREFDAINCHYCGTPSGLRQLGVARGAGFVILELICTHCNIILEMNCDLKFIDRK